MTWRTRIWTDFDCQAEHLEPGQDQIAVAVIDDSNNGHISTARLAVNDTPSSYAPSAFDRFTCYQASFAIARICLLFSLTIYILLYQLRDERMRWWHVTIAEMQNMRGGSLYLRRSASGRTVVYMLYC